VPRSLVCFDISHAQGTDTVASCVWFENARAKRAEYRKFKVETVQGIDDFASMREVVGRYFRRRLDEERPLPTSSSSTAARAAQRRARGARGGRARRAPARLARQARGGGVRLRPLGPAAHPAPLAGLRMLQQARDEAHRFAVTFQRKRRAVRTVTSELMTVPGTRAGEASPALQHFGSVQAIREAAPDAIAALPDGPRPAP
jgi:excinuclease ABC subunit C